MACHQPLKCLQINSPYGSQTFYLIPKALKNLLFAEVVNQMIGLFGTRLNY